MLMSFLWLPSWNGVRQCIPSHVYYMYWPTFEFVFIIITVYSGWSECINAVCAYTMYRRYDTPSIQLALMNCLYALSSVETHCPFWQRKSWYVSEMSDKLPSLTCQPRPSHMPKLGIKPWVQWWKANYTNITALTSLPSLQSFLLL